MTIEIEDADRSRILQAEIDAMVLRDTRERYTCSEPGHFEEGEETYLARSPSLAAEMHAMWLWNRCVRCESFRIAVVDPEGVRTAFDVAVQKLTPTFSAVQVESEESK